MSAAIVTCQGRVADRTPGAIRGAALTAEALESRLGLTRIEVGRPEEPREDGWEESLAAAETTLAGLQVAVAGVVEAGNVPVVATNTCAASLATLPVAARDPETTVLWIDAHGDFNTPASTGSGYLGGMVLAGACGLWDSGHGAGLDPERLIIVGARDIDGDEGRLLDRAGVGTIAPDEAGPERVLAECGQGPLWVHVDWDALEPGIVPAAYRVPGGLTAEQVRDLLSALDPARIAGLELAEFEATGDAAEDGATVARIMEMVGPLADRIAQ